MGAHIIRPRTYTVIFLALLVLLALTVIASRFDAGPLNPVIAMGIAVAKAVLIVLYFMHLRYAAPLVRVFACAALVWVAFGAALMLGDYTTRGWLDANAPATREPALDRRIPVRELEPSPGLAETRAPED